MSHSEVFRIHLFRSSCLVVSNAGAGERTEFPELKQNAQLYFKALDLVEFRRHLELLRAESASELGVGWQTPRNNDVNQMR